MAILSGQVTEYGLYGQSPGSSDWSSGLKGFDPAVYLDLSSTQSGDLTIHGIHQKVYRSEHSVLLNASVTHHYELDYYYRIHVKPNPIKLGDLLSQETRRVYVWNAFFNTQTLNDITEQNADGININEPVSAPYDFAPLEEQIYLINISTAGPPTIDAGIGFAFSVYTVTLNITGSRVTLFTLKPRENYTENLEWRTNILRTRVGEQRIALREAPRQILNHAFVENEENTSKIKLMTSAWNFRTWGLPIWKESTSGVSASTGDLSINFDTSDADYRENGLAILWENSENNIAVRITNVRVDGIDIDPELAQDWNNVLVAPLRKAITPEGFEFARGEKGKYTDISVSFLITDNIDLSETGDYDTYRGYDVLTDGNIITDTLSERVSRPLVQIDNGQGPVTLETTQDYSNFARSVGKISKTKAELWRWRKWLHSKYGKQKPFWLPSWNQDIILARTAQDADIEIEIEYIGLTKYGDFPLDFSLRLNDGTIFYRRITSCIELTEGNEQITIDNPFGQVLEPGDIDLWSFMDLVRFNSDSIELSHSNPYIMRTTIPVMKVPE